MAQVHSQIGVGPFLYSHYSLQKFELQRLTAILTSKTAYRVNQGMALA